MVKVLYSNSYLRNPTAVKLIRRNTNIPIFKSWLENHVDLQPELETPVDEAVEYLTRQVHLAVSIATPEIETTRTVHTRGLRDNYLWSTELASMVSEKRRLRRVWQLSRSRSDKTIYNRACKDLSRMLLDLKSKSLEAYLADLEPCSADHKLWNATKYLKRPTRRIAPVRSLTGAWCRLRRIVEVLEERISVGRSMPSGTSLPTWTSSRACPRKERKFWPKEFGYVVLIEESF